MEYIILHSVLLIGGLIALIWILIYDKKQEKKLKADNK